MNKEKINKLRKIIDDIDLSILRLIIKRSLVVEKIGKIKNSNKDIIDKGRESKVLNKLIKLHSGRFPKDSIIRIWREIFYASAKVQLKTRKTFYPKRELNSPHLWQKQIIPFDRLKGGMMTTSPTWFHACVLVISSWLMRPSHSNKLNLLLIGGD